MTEKQPPLLEVGKFYRRWFNNVAGIGYTHNYIVYVSSIKDHGYTHTYFGVSENTRNPETQCDCGQYYWERMLGYDRPIIEKEYWEPLSEKDSILAASRFFSTYIRQKFCLPVHPAHVQSRLNMLEMTRRFSKPKARA